ncbi:MAG: sporulation integral membrane protein YtvI [Bacillota bacterium]|jgi:sporulation integral membrane protein YtvI
MDRLIKAGTVTAVCISLYLIYYFIMPAAGEIISFVFPALIPFIFALVVAVLIDPIVKWLTKHLKLPRGFAVLSVLLAVFGTISGILVLIISKLVFELQRLSGNMPDFNKIFTRIFQEAEYLYYTIDLKPEVMAQIQQTITSITGTATDFIYSAINAILHLLTSLPNIFIVLVITIIATFFFSRDKEKIEKFFLGLVPKKWQGRVEHVYRDLTRALVGYIGAILTLVSITAVITITGLSILGMEYAFTMGLLTGFFDILPVLGPGMVFVPWIIISLVLGNIKLTISLLVLYIIIIVQRQILEPKLVADTIDVHPLATLAAIFIGLQFFGAGGVILGPVILVTGRAIKKVI